MSIFYSGQRDDTFRGDVWKMDGTKAYLRHYGNWLQLDFIAKATSRISEKFQALKEMEIAERKMEYWKRHPNYVHADALRGIEELKRDWGRVGAN